MSRKVLKYMIIASLFVFVLACNTKKSNNKKITAQEILEVDNPSFNPSTGEFKVDKYTIALWHFNEGSLSKKVENEMISYDASPKGNHGIIVRGKWGKGIFKSCLDLSGSGDSFEVDDEKQKLSPRYAVTVEAWFHFSENITAPYPLLIGKATTSQGNGDPNYNFGVTNYRHDDFPEYFVNWAISTVEGGYIHVTGRENWKSLIGAWHYLAGTYNGKEIKMYVDGKLKDRKEHKGILKTADKSLLVGRTGGQEYNGLIDEIRISNVARSEKAIKEYWEGSKRFRDK